jgi:hypothetical protein
MNRILSLFCLALLAAITMGIIGSSPSTDLPRMAAAPEHRVETSAAPPAIESRGSDISPEVFSQQDILDAISQLKLDSEKKGFNSVIDLLATQDPSYVENILRQIPDPELCGYLLNRLTSRWAQQKPAETAKWLLGLPEEIERTQALISMGRVWAETDPAQAAAYAGQFPPGKLRQQVLTAALSVWIQHDTAAAANWIIQASPTPDLDSAVAEIARDPQVIHGDVTVALSWAESITNEEQRRQSIALILADWAQRDRASAIQYAESTSALNPTQRDALMADLNFNH